MIDNLAMLDADILKKALKRKSEEAGDCQADGDSGASTSKQWSHADIKAIHSNLGLTDKQTKGLAKAIREKEGNRKAVEPHLRDYLVKQKQLLSEYYSAEMITFKFGKDNVEKEIPTVYCNDLKGLIRRVCVLRNESDEDIYSKIGIDSGKGMDM